MRVTVVPATTGEEDREYVFDIHNHGSMELTSCSPGALALFVEVGTSTVAFRTDQVCKGHVLINDEPYDHTAVAPGDRLSFIRTPGHADELTVPIGTITKVE